MQNLKDLVLQLEKSGSSKTKAQIQALQQQNKNFLQVSNNITAQELQAVIKDKTENMRDVITNPETLNSYYSNSKSKKKRRYWEMNSSKELRELNSFALFQTPHQNLQTLLMNLTESSFWCQDVQEVLDVR